MCTARLFSQGVDLFAFKFYLDRVVPISHSWLQKTRDTALLDGVNRIPLRSLVLTQYRSVTHGRTDRRTDEVQRDDAYLPSSRRSSPSRNRSHQDITSQSWLQTPHQRLVIQFTTQRRRYDRLHAKTGPLVSFRGVYGLSLIHI